MACKETVRWLYHLEEDFKWQSPFRVERDYAFQDAGGTTRLVITAEDQITVLKTYFASLAAGQVSGNE